MAGRNARMAQDGKTFTLMESENLWPAGPNTFNNWAIMEERTQA
jgi:hypothetical protein